MSDFFPLIVDGSGTPAIKEIPSGDVLDLSGVTVKAITVDGVSSFSDGTAGAPSITNTGDTNCGLYFSAADTLAFTAGGVAQFTLEDGAIVPVTDNDIDLGTSSLEFKDAYFDGTVTSDAFAGPLTGDVTGNVSGSAATVTGAAQSSITSLGTLTTLTVDNVIVNGTTIGHTSDTDLMTLADGVLTVAGEVDATSLDISGDADIDGTLEADAITVDGTALNEYIADTVGAMVGSNTESGITVAYQDGDNTLDFTVGTLNQNTTGSAATLTTARTIGGVSFDGSANITPTTFATASFSGVVTAATSAKITQVAITSSSNAVAWDAAAAANAYHVTTENTTFSAPSNAVEGAIISVELAQGGTARTIAWNTVFEFAASTAPTVTATANKTDIFSFRYNGSVWQEIGRVQNMAQT